MGKKCRLQGHQHPSFFPLTSGKRKINFIYISGSSIWEFNTKILYLKKIKKIKPAIYYSFGSLSHPDFASTHAASTSIRSRTPPPVKKPANFFHSIYLQTQVKKIKIKKSSAE